jgi:glycolate oxidase
MDLAVGLGAPDYLGPEAMELNQRIENARDPDGILNPGAAI